MKNSADLGGCHPGGGGGGGSNPLPFHIPFWQKRYPFYIPFIEKGYPFHIPILGSIVLVNFYNLKGRLFEKL